MPSSPPVAALAQRQHVLAAVSLAPTVLFVAIGMPRLEPERTLVAHGELDSSLPIKEYALTALA